jgi:hypothetical protein
MWWLWSACGPGATEDSGTNTPACGDEATTPLAETDAASWPDGLADALVTYGELGGLWRTQMCGDPDATLDITLTLPTQEAFGVYTATPPAADCGCSQDPSFLPDGAYGPLAAVDIDVFVGDYLDPALANQSVPLKAVAFRAGEPLAIRACGGKTIDPILGSTWTDGSVMVRVDGAGALSGTLVLVEDGSSATETCELTEWVFVSP